MSDYIKREDAILAIAGLNPNESIHESVAAAWWAKKALSSVPSADVVERKRGEWKRRIVDNGFNADWVCSECGYRVKTDFVDYNFCPNCGADMRGESDE